jgi:hypothetical protein
MYNITNASPIKPYLDWNDVFEKGNESRRLALVGKIKVHAIAKSLNAQTTSMSSMFQNELFQVEKGSLVPYSLSYLNK